MTLFDASPDEQDDVASMTNAAGCRCKKIMPDQTPEYQPVLRTIHSAGILANLRKRGGGRIVNGYGI